LVGPRVGAFLAGHFSGKPAAGRCVHGTLRDGPRDIDDPVVVLHAGGGAADVNLHGGPWVVRSVLELASREGFEVLERPGLPLPDEAVDAETELGREVLRYLPMARTELALRVLLAQEQAWAGPELQGEAARAAVDDRSLYWLLHPPRVAIVGVPNVGKSTLANQLFGTERSITADVPGTTRDWVGEVANVDGLAVMLVDTPGLRETVDVIERESIGQARGKIAAADLVVVVVDPTQGAEAQGQLMRSHPCALGVANKSDLAAPSGTLQEFGWVETVATTGRGVDQVRRAIRRHFLGTDVVCVGQRRWWTGRQRVLLERVMAEGAGTSDK
jgi:small GTP-binding protein